MELRGFDSYTVTLGDELRGERACRGWSLRDAARELCIKREMIAAIENADLTAFPNRSVVPGYVRSYARYLGLDGDEIFRRFCEESGFESTLVTFGMTDAGGQGRADAKDTAVTGPVGADFTASRFAVRPAPRRIGASVSLGGIVSGVSLCALIAALGYGGYAVLQDIQRVGFAPLPDAPAVVADAPEIAAPIATAAARPDIAAYGAGGALFGLSSDDTIEVARRDGPIAAIDPEETGLVTAPALAQRPSTERRARLAAAPVGLPGELAAARREAARRAASAGAGEAGFVTAGDGRTPLSAEEFEAAAAEVAAATASATAPAATPDGTRRILVTDRAWLRVRDDAGNKIFEGILEAGDGFDIPEGVEAPTLRAGNAGGVFVAIGADRYGPLGAPGQVIKGVSLSVEAVTGRFSAARPAAEPDLTSASR